MDKKDQGKNQSKKSELAKSLRANLLRRKGKSEKEVEEENRKQPNQDS